MDIAYLVFDIETVADGRLVQRVRYPDEPTLTPAEAVARYREKLLADNGTDFIPHTFQLPVSVAIAKVATDFRLVDLCTLDRPAFRPQTIARQFWKGWQHYGQPTLVTFNGRGFDLPVLEMCAFRYGIPVPAWFKNDGPNWEQPRNRYASAAHFDLQEFLTSFGAARQSGGLDLLATLLGKPGKMDTKGHMVQDLWQAGEHQRIDDYCICDALDTYFVFLRCQLLRGKLPSAREQELVAQARALIEEKSTGIPALGEYLARFGDWRAVDDDAWPFLDPADRR